MDVDRGDMSFWGVMIDDGWVAKRIREGVVWGSGGLRWLFVVLVLLLFGRDFLYVFFVKAKTPC